jgi:cation transport ATPase
MMIVVKPGELIPVDGIVTSGSSSISEADLTMEIMSLCAACDTLPPRCDWFVIS